jgi:hypothetical protein
LQRGEEKDGAAVMPKQKTDDPVAENADTVVEKHGMGGETVSVGFGHQCV